MKNYESLADALADLRKRGYEADFETQSPCLYCSDLDLRLIEEEFHVDEVYRLRKIPILTITRWYMRSLLQQE